MRTTVNRLWLKKQIIAGNIEIKRTQILTDDYAFDAAYNFQKSDWKLANIEDFTEMDFKYGSGRAYWNDDKTVINWTLLANHYYECRLKK